MLAHLKFWQYFLLFNFWRSLRRVGVISSSVTQNLLSGPWFLCWEVYTDSSLFTSLFCSDFLFIPNWSHLSYIILGMNLSIYWHIFFIVFSYYSLFLQYYLKYFSNFNFESFFLVQIKVCQFCLTLIKQLLISFMHSTVFLQTLLNLLLFRYLLFPYSANFGNNLFFFLVP